MCYSTYLKWRRRTIVGSGVWRSTCSCRSMHLANIPPPIPSPRCTPLVCLNSRKFSKFQKNKPNYTERLMLCRSPLPWFKIVSKRNAISKYCTESENPYNFVTIQKVKFLKKKMNELKNKIPYLCTRKRTPLGGIPS